MPDHDVVVAGGGPVGLLLGCTASRRVSAREALIRLLGSAPLRTRTTALVTMRRV